MRCLFLLLALATPCGAVAPPVAIPVGASSVFVVYPADCNHLGTLFGGKQLAEMDRIAGVVVRRVMARTGQAGRLAATSAIERAEFKRPGKVGERTVTVRATLRREDGKELSWGDFTFTVIDEKTRRSVPHGLAGRSKE